MPVLSVEDFRSRARERLPADVWDFVEGGSGDELALAGNLAAFARHRLRPRVLVDVGIRTTTTSLLGADLALPVGIAPTAYHRMVHPDGEIATATGAGTAGALFVVSFFASQPLAEIAAAAGGPLWLQLYWLRRRDVMVELLDRAGAAGYRALVLTVDAPYIGRRHRDMRNAFAVDPSVRAVNLDRAVMASAHQSRPGTSAVAQHAAEAFDPTVTWADLAWLREQTELPLVLKGILTAEDAVLAVEHGVAGIVVSNHGGRQLDPAVAGIDALPEVVDAVAGRCAVLVDGGVRRGTDVLTAIALGADAVLVGRPALWALAAGGAGGVAELLDLLRTELDHAMALAGCRSLAEIGRGLVASPTPVVVR